MVDPQLAWIALFAPLAARIIITLFLLRSKNLASLTAIAGILLSFACTLTLALQIFQAHPAAQVQHSIPWIHFNGLAILVLIYRHFNTIQADELKDLKW